MLLAPMLAMAGLGLAKGELVDKPREKRQRMVAAETARYSPWTHMQPQAVQEADPFGNAMQGGMAGAMFSQSQQNAETQGKLMNSMGNYYDKQATMGQPAPVTPGQSPWSLMGNYPNAPYPYAAGQGPVRPY